MTHLDNQMRQLAEGLRDVLRDTPDTLENDPEETFVDLAARLVLRLRGTLTVVPDRTAQLARIEKAEAEAAMRIFAIFTAWLEAHPECSYETKIGLSGKVEMTVNGGQAFFSGGSVQDAYGQAAQTISFNGGSL